MADELKDYKVTETRFIGGHHRVVGEPIQMSERAAKYYVAPYGTGLKLASPAAGQPAGKTDAKPANKAAKTES